MGIRGELYSTKVILDNRTYFFNVKENRLGDLYLNIVESKNKDTGGFDRQSVVLFADDLQDFLKGFDESLRVMEKAVRDKKKEARPERPARTERQDRSDRTERGFSERGASEREFSGRGKGKAEGRGPVSREGFERNDRSHGRHGEKRFGRDEGFKPRSSGRSDDFRPKGERSFGKEGGTDFGPARKKFVKSSKRTAGPQGMTGPLRKSRIVKAVRKKDIPED
jgi:hypothetical protein